MMIDYNEQDKESIAMAIAELDSVIISARDQQLSLGKILARITGIPEESILNALKEASISLLVKNGLGY